MAVDPRCTQLEQEIEDCISGLQSLASAKIDDGQIEGRVISMKRRLTELCTALGWLLQQRALTDASPGAPGRDRRSVANPIPAVAADHQRTSAGASSTGPKRLERSPGSGALAGIWSGRVAPSHLDYRR
jgi:hypothetical protein